MSNQGSDRRAINTAIETAPLVFRPEAGMVVENYELVESLGQGAMGQVWKAVDPQRKDEHSAGFVALKFLPPELQRVRREWKRMESTFRNAQGLQHPCICPLYQLINGHTGPILVMKYVDGLPLMEFRDEYVDLHGDFPLEVAVGLLKKIAEALDYAHDPSGTAGHDVPGVVHRDIKPENILVTSDGKGVQIVDFGIAARIRHTMTNFSNRTVESVGTRPYMAPEQWRCEEPDAKTDQYALGVVAYELLSDRFPFVAEDQFALEQAVLERPVPPLTEQSKNVNSALERVMAKERGLRFPKCREFVVAISAETDSSTPLGESSVPAKESAETPVTITSPRDGDIVADRVISVSGTSSGFPSGTRLPLWVNADKPVRQNDCIVMTDGTWEAFGVDLKGTTHDIYVENNEGQVISNQIVVSRVSSNKDVNAVESRERTVGPSVSKLLDAPFSPRAINQANEELASLLEIPISWRNSIGMRFHLIPPGSFMMGYDGGKPEERPEHRVSIPKPLFVAECPVTMREYEQVIGRHSARAGHSTKLNRPVERISWEDANHFAQQLSWLPEEDDAGRLYRLPTEAEWEYASRAGSTSNQDPTAGESNCHFYRDPETEVSGKYPANAFGLHDTRGNIWEWCSDVFTSDYTDSVDGRSDTEVLRVLRGGSFNCEPDSCRHSSRIGRVPNFESYETGFRLVCEVGK